ncbi:hypothetical protein CCHR01_04103 [Colletotrichum chrysophilum]|uniref:Uncharacterized protein n=1 Tax=Colletotrichum chrysophilum TaxID=1836956 RepID=A0AAD9AU20_9PEZI|nr:hypothetical protein CCHR01_04103 [Colletotrichum chrysophilum]
MTVSCHPDETEDVVWRERMDESAPVTLCKLQEKTTLLAVASGSGRENSPGECSSDGMGWDGTDRKKRDESGKGREKKETGKSRLQSVHAHPGRVDEDPSNVERRDKDDSPMLVPAAGSPMEMGWHLQESAAVRYGMACVACSFCRVSGFWGSQWSSLVSLGDGGHSFGFLLGGSDHILHNSTMGTNKQLRLG